jgi:tRNA 2-selenouridine synthase
VSLATFSDYKKLITDKISLIDVRAPIEFEKGAFETSVNLPLMSNKERELVGIRYKNNGNEAAIELGYKLVSGEIKEQRVKAWLDFINKNPNAIIYCFRGGQRSQISQKWLLEAGIEIARIEGGYKAFRGYLIEQLDSMQNSITPIRLGGTTGSGKTIVLKKLENSIDLEALANHRGSAFGNHITPQPTQINFENNLAFAIIKKLEMGKRVQIFEDEGRNIGRVYLPKKIYEYINSSDLVVLETPLEKRVEITFNEYVVEAQNEYKIFFNKGFLQEWAKSILGNLEKIHKRLGDKLYKEIKELFLNALKEQELHNNLELHKVWIEHLLTIYYDPMYEYQLSKKSNIVFRGSEAEVIEYLQNRSKLS